VWLAGTGQFVIFAFNGRSWFSGNNGLTWAENGHQLSDQPNGADGGAVTLAAAGNNGGVYVSYDQEQEDHTPVAAPTVPAAYGENDDMSGDAVRRLVTQFRSGRG
jgi:hypothetical protein